MTGDGSGKAPSRAEIMARVRALAPGISGRAAAAEAMRRVPAETSSELRAAGLFRMVQPRRFGGWEQDYDLLIETVMALAAACASTAWVYAIAAGQHMMVANFPLAAQEEIWGRTQDAITCGAYAPQGQAEAAPGGFRLDGSWSFVSGCDIADWALIGAALPQEGGRQPSFVLVPSGDYAIEDNWHTVGLAATGSKSIVLRDVFVPAHRVLPFARMTSCRVAGTVPHANPMYRLPMLAFVPSVLGAVAIGAATGAVESFIAASRVRTTRGGVATGKTAVAGFTAVQMRVAEALAATDAGATIVLRDNRAALATLRMGEDLSVAERITIRRGQGFAVRLAVQAIETVANATGIGGIFLDHPVHRAWRDAIAASRHISLNWDAVAAMVGQEALGLEPPANY
ncbi:MAG TPA: flavin-dependent monooxygenase [Stellaceae bacterium]|nr:flavin-dependent monooxygenase [Stellaceae bacterium]